MKKLSTKVSYFILIMFLIAVITGCSSKEMTTKKYCRIQKEIADLGINNYFDFFINKKYDEMKKSYSQYVKECSAIYKKYNTTGVLLKQWGDEHEEEIANCLKSHPELDYRKIHGNKYDSFTWNIYYFLEKKVKHETAE